MKLKNKKTFLQQKRLKIKNFKNILSHKSEIKKKGPWSSEEDLILKKWVEEKGPKNWKQCSKAIPGRNQSQCRQHWNIKLKPNLKVGNWSSEEIFLIIVFYKKLNGSWTKMIPIFKSRTENSIKNIFFSQTRKIVSKINNEAKKTEKAFDLNSILKFYHEIYEEVKKKFLKDNPMSEKELEEYITNIELMLINKSKKEKFIDIENLKKYKNNNNNIINNEINNESALNKNIKKFKKLKIRNVTKKSKEKNKFYSIKTEKFNDLEDKDILFKEIELKIQEKQTKEKDQINRKNGIEDNKISNNIQNFINNNENYEDNHSIFNNINNTNGLKNYINFKIYSQFLNNYIYFCNIMNRNINNILNYNSVFINSLILNPNNDIYSNNNFNKILFNNINNYFLLNNIIQNNNFNFNNNCNINN